MFAPLSVTARLPAVAVITRLLGRLSPRIESVPPEKISDALGVARSSSSSTASRDFVCFVMMPLSGVGDDPVRPLGRADRVTAFGRIPSARNPGYGEPG